MPRFRMASTSALSCALAELDTLTSAATARDPTATGRWEDNAIPENNATPESGAAPVAASRNPPRRRERTPSRRPVDLPALHDIVACLTRTPDRSQRWRRPCPRRTSQILFQYGPSADPYHRAVLSPAHIRSRITDAC